MGCGYTWLILVAVSFLLRRETKPQMLRFQPILCDLTNYCDYIVINGTHNYAITIVELIAGVTGLKDQISVIDPHFSISKIWSNHFLFVNSIKFFFVFFVIFAEIVKLSFCFLAVASKVDFILQFNLKSSHKQIIKK